MRDEPQKLPPLRPSVPPRVPIEMLVTIGKIRLAAGDIPRGILKEFYTHTLGLTFMDANENLLRFRHHQREILLDRERIELGRAGLLIRGFGAALIRLRAGKINYELLHTDGGLSRAAIVRDPVGNWIHLVEMRAF